MSSYRRRLLLANQTEENLYLYGNSVQDGTPTPEAPIDIMSVENPTIKARGNNLFNNDFSLLKNVMYVSTSGTKTTRKGYELNLPVGTYIMKPYLNPDATSSSAYCYACLLDKNRNYKQKLNLVEQTYLPPQTPFNIENGDILLIYDGISGHTSEQAQVYFERYDIMLNLGATALPYEPYEEELIIIDETTPFGKNLIPNNYSAGTSGIFTYTPNEDGVITINGTGNGTGNSVFNLISSNLNNYLIDGETYSFCINTNTNITDVNKLHIYIYAKRKDTGEQVWLLGAWGEKINQITVDKSLYDYVKLYIQISPTTATFEDLVVSPIMARGSYIELPFEPYIPPITTMRGIGDYKDRIYTKDGKVWFEQKSGYCETDADTTLYRNGTDENVIQAYTTAGFVDDSYSALGVETTKAANNPGLSTHFVYSFKAYTKTQIDTVLCSGTRLWFVSDNFENIDKWNTWIKENKVSIIYPLKTPIITEITGYLAEKILAVDKTKNITISSENGVWGSVEVIDG